MQFSIVNKSESDKSSDFRIDAEYWHPIFIKNSNLIRSGRKIRDFTDPAVLNINSSPINRDFEYLEISRISLSGCDYETTKIKSGEEPDRAHYILQKDDVAVSTVRPNRNAVALIRKNGIVGSSGLSILRANGIDPNYLFAFCKTDYFTRCLMRADKASMYPAVSDGDILNMPILIPSMKFGSLISKFIKESIRFFDKGKKAYTQAQISLLSELGLTNWQPRHQLNFVKNYSDTEQAGRIDADYFQPKYEEIVNAIRDYVGGWNTLGDLVTVKKCVEVGSNEYLDEGVPFVRVSNLSPFEITEEKYISDKLYKEMKQHQPEKEEILFSKDATPGIAYLFNEAPQKMIPSSGILRLKNATQKVNNEYLILVLNSLLIKEQISRDVGGSVILHWRPDQVIRAIIPILPEAKQAQIQKKVTESLNLRKQSKCLLKCAKKAVEIAIEQDEKKAIARLKDCLPSKVS